MTRMSCDAVHADQSTKEQQLPHQIELLAKKQNDHRYADGPTDVTSSTQGDADKDLYTMAALHRYQLYVQPNGELSSITWRALP